MKNLILLLIAVVVAGSVSLGQNATQNVSIVGRVVDPEGKPFAFAEVIYLPHPDADMAYSAKSAKDGTFTLRLNEISRSGKLWVTNRIDWENWNVPISPGANLVSKYVKGTAITLKHAPTSNEINLGDIAVQVRYIPVKFLIGKGWKERVLNAGAISFKITDGGGEIAAKSIGGRGKKLEDSSLTVALPEGRWTLEIKTSKMGWEKLMDKIDISKRREITINFPSP